jgi:hypothetical protein
MVHAINALENEVKNKKSQTLREFSIFIESGESQLGYQRMTIK